MLPKTVEDMQPFTLDKRDMAYKSRIPRDPLGPKKDKKVSPGPGHYDLEINMRNTLVIRNQTNFGSDMIRESLIHRNIAN